MVLKIKYDGTEGSILKIIEHLPGDTKWVRREGKSITIPAGQIFEGESVIIENNKVRIIEKYNW